VKTVEVPGLGLVDFPDTMTEGEIQHKLAEFTRQRPTLLKLSGYFEVYLDALNELSERYVTGFDFNLIADKMLDRFNLYRRTGDERHREEARRYAALLRLDSRRFPALYRRARPHLL